MAPDVTSVGIGQTGAAKFKEPTDVQEVGEDYQLEEFFIGQPNDKLPFLGVLHDIFELHLLFDLPLKGDLVLVLDQLAVRCSLLDRGPVVLCEWDLLRGRRVYSILWPPYLARCP